MSAKEIFLFAGDRYYPEGGVQDFVGKFSKVEQAKKEIEKNGNGIDGFDWAQIVEADTMKILYRYWSRYDWETETRTSKWYKSAE